MKPQVTTAIVVCALALVMFLIVFQLARTSVGMKPPKLGQSQSTGSMNLVWFALVLNFIVCFAVVRFTSLEKTGALWTSIGVGIIGFIICLIIVATRGMAEYVHLPLSWASLGALATCFGSGSAAFMKRS